MKSQPKSQSQAARTWHVLGFWIFAAVALALLLAEHRAHAWGWRWHVLLLGGCLALLLLLIRAARGDGTRG